MLSSHLSDAGRISFVGILVPAVACGALGSALAGNERFFPADSSSAQAVLFLASALAVIAFPVLARILTDTGAAQARIGTLAISAAIDDAVAWSLLALTLALASDSAAGPAATLIGAAAYAAGMVVLIRPILGRLDQRSALPYTLTGLTWILAGVMACATLTEWIGVHAVLGAFFAGAVLPRGRLIDYLRHSLEPLAVTILLPVFFVYAVLNTRIGLLDDGSLVWIGGAIILVAFLSKGGGCTIAMRLGGASYRTSGALSVLMNARGLLELTLISIGLEWGLITPELYTVLDIMAVATTVAATPHFLRLKDLQSECPTVDAIDTPLMQGACEHEADNSCRGRPY